MEGASHSSALTDVRYDRPRWWPVIVGVFIGYLWAALTLTLAAFVLALIGVMSWSSAPRGNHWLGAPFEPDGLWSLVTNATVAFTVLAVTSTFVVWALAQRAERRVSWTISFLALGITGYAPYFFFEGRLRLSGLIGLLLTAWLIRSFGLAGRQPADFLASLEESAASAGFRNRRIATLFATAWAAAIGLGVAYGVTHPLTIAGGSGPSERARPLQPGSDTVYEVLRGKAGATRNVLIFLRNNGFADLHDVRIEPMPNERLPLLRAAFGAKAWSPHASGSSQATVPGRDGRLLSLFIQIPSCDSGFRTVDRVRIRYAILGHEQSQPLRLDPPLAARCPRGH